MKILRNRKVVVGSSVLLAMIITMSATFAWITASTQTENKFSNKGYANSDVVVINEYFPDPELKIGEINTKEVQVTNTGSDPMLVRVTFEEMIKLLGNSGQITMSINSAPETGMIPVPVDESVFTTANLWADITTDITPAVPTGVKVFKRGNIYNGYYTDGTNYQKISVSLKDNQNGTYTLQNPDPIKYAFYTDGTAKYNYWNTGKATNNYAPWISKDFEDIKPAATAIKKSSLSTDVILEYDSDVSVTIVNDNWYYNENDGYFYWIGVLDGGQSTNTLLSGVGVDGNASQAIWQKYDYSLVVCLEVLQATKEALTDTTATDAAAGWKLSTGALLTALEAAIDAYNA